MSEEQQVMCPTCGGRKMGAVHVQGERDGRRFSEWRYQACDYCHGEGTVAASKAAKWETGRLLMADRRSRGLSLREEAARLGVTPKELSDREHGRA